MSLILSYSLWVPMKRIATVPAKNTSMASPIVESSICCQAMNDWLIRSMEKRHNTEKAQALATYSDATSLKFPTFHGHAEYSKCC